MLAQPRDQRGDERRGGPFGGQERALGPALDRAGEKALGPAELVQAHGAGIDRVQRDHDVDV
ncbi:hypothetical protein [Haliangium sp.]|uniref:hypothetical protein n=1 Tax=Haliangium sp. TaxID=2663208 RepID=UPI003D124222